MMLLCENIHSPGQLAWCWCDLDSTGRYIPQVNWVWQVVDTQPCAVRGGM